jgi:CheY-like chemotaxis protein
VEQSRKHAVQFVAIRPAEETILAVVTQAATAPRPGQARKRALLVEANTSSLRLCRDILERSGFRIETAGSGIAALTSAREQQPDLIVMDLQLPDVPGREFVGWLRDVPNLRSTPIIIFAGATGDTTNLAHLGANALLHKPVSAPMIHRAIREAMKSD